MKNIIHVLTGRHLQRNKGRSVITILGIAVSAAMLTAVFVSLASFANFEGEITLFSSGNKHAVFQNVTKKQQEQLKKDDRIAKIGCFVIPETEGSFRLKESEVTYKETGDLYVGDEENLRMMVTGSYEGKLPANENEIAIQDEFLKANKKDVKVGDVLAVSVGIRRESGDKQSVLRGSNVVGELFEAKGERQFRITAILHNNRPTYSTPILRGMSEQEKNGVANTAVCLEKIGYQAIDDIKGIAKKYEIKEYDINNSYLQSKFVKGSLDKSLISMVSVILSLIMLASVMLISNAFSMSLSEKVRYLGMLASVGATRRQKRGSIYFEGFLLGLIGIPVGILAGIAGISITLKILMEKMISSGMMNIDESSLIGFHTVVPWWVIVFVILLDAVTIFISSVIPARKASRIVPVEAIRQNKEIKVKARKLHVPFYIRKLFGYEGELAYKNLRRNGKKATVIVASLVVSVVLFLCVNHFCELFMLSNETDMQPFQLQARVKYTDKERLFNTLDGMDGIDNYYLCSIESTNMASLANEKENDGFLDEGNLKTVYREFWEDDRRVCVCPVLDKDFNEMCLENEISPDGFYGNKVKGLLLNNVTRKEGGNKVFNENIIGKTVYQMLIYMTKEEENDPETKVVPWAEVAGLVDYKETNSLYKLPPKNSICIYVPESVYEKYYEKETAKAFQEDVDTNSIFVGIETAKHKEVAAALEKIFAERRFSDAYVSDMIEIMKAVETVVFVMSVFIYGFVTLITLITVANIVNTIATGVYLRKKEYAMLRSVGITPKGFYKMISLESVFYGLRALLVGIPLSILFNYIMSTSLNVPIPFSLNGSMYLLVIAAVFVIVCGTMVYAVKKVRKDNIIESLKEDIN